MAVDKVESSAANASAESAAARAVAEKRRALEQEKSNLEMEKARAARERNLAINAEREKTENALVEVSKVGSNQLEIAQRMNSERMRMYNESTQKNFEAIAQKTAAEVARMDQDAVKMIDERRKGAMERVKTVTDKAEDPFYRIRSLNPVLSELDKDFVVKIALPEHEAQNLFVTGEGQTLKISLARRFQENARDAESARSTRTSSYQSVVEQLAMPGAIDVKNIRREYADGVVTIKVAKVLPFVPEAPIG